MDDSPFVHECHSELGLLFRFKSAQPKFKKLDFPDQLRIQKRKSLSERQALSYKDQRLLSEEHDSSQEEQRLPQNPHFNKTGSQEPEAHKSDDVQQRLPQSQHFLETGIQELEADNDVQLESKSQNRKSSTARESTFYTVSDNILYAYSAYYDNRQPQVYKFGVVRVFMLYNEDHLKRSTSALRCHLRYTLPNDTDTEMVCRIQTFF